MRFRLSGAAFAAVAMLACALPANADNYPVRDGSGATQTFASKLSSAIQHPEHLLEILFGGTPAPVSAGQATKANSLPVALPSDPDTRYTSANITAADAASTTIAGQGSVTLVTGTPTANSAQPWVLNGHSSLTIQATGTFVLTAPIEVSADCATYAPRAAKITGTGITTAAITAPGVFSVDVTGMACARVRATSYTSGTLAVLANASASPGLTNVLNPVPLRGLDGATSASGSNPVPVQGAITTAASSNASGTVATGGTYQTLFASSTSRKGCLVQNPTTATEVLNVRVGGAAVFTVAAGNTFNCAAPSGVVISDLIEVTAATSTHAFTAVSQ